MAVTAPFATYDRSFADVLGDEPRLDKVADVDAHEGPVYVAAEHALYFTTLPDPRPLVSIKRLALDTLDVTVVRAHANAANGMTLAPDGRLLVCEQGTLSEPARISLVDRATGEAETVVDGLDGLPLNSPNDVVVRHDGTVWFSDPSYGHLQGFRPAPELGDHVYRYDPRSGRLEVAATGFDKPNGLAFSPDERVLYVSDNGAPHHLLAYDVHDDGSLGAARPLFVGTPDHPDGVKVDDAGRIYASASTGIHVLAPDGRLIGEIRLRGAVNFTFGGPDRSVLFITADAALWAAHLEAKGA